MTRPLSAVNVVVWSALAAYSFANGEWEIGWLRMIIALLFAGIVTITWESR